MLAKITHIDKAKLFYKFIIKIKLKFIQALKLTPKSLNFIRKAFSIANNFNEMHKYEEQ